MNGWMAAQPGLVRPFRVIVAMTRRLPNIGSGPVSRIPTVTVLYSTCNDNKFYHHTTIVGCVVLSQSAPQQPGGHHNASACWYKLIPNMPSNCLLDKLPPLILRLTA